MCEPVSYISSSVWRIQSGGGADEEWTGDSSSIMPAPFCAQDKLDAVSMREPDALENFNATEEGKFGAGSAESPLLARGLRIAIRIMVGSMQGSAKDNKKSISFN